MRILFWLKLYLLTLPVFLAIDLLWLGFLARRFYAEQLAAFLQPRIDWVAASGFYLIYIAGLLFFAVRPALEAGSLGKAVLLGALFGFFTYATYDLTNLATLRGWPVQVTVVDLAWGTVLGALVSGASLLIGTWLGPWLDHGGSRP